MSTAVCTYFSHFTLLPDIAIWFTGYKKCGNITMCVFVASPKSSRKLSKMEPKSWKVLKNLYKTWIMAYQSYLRIGMALTYVESKQAKLTRSKLNEFLISFLQMMTLTMVLPKMPKMATIVVKIPSIQKEKKSRRFSDDSPYWGQSRSKVSFVSWKVSFKTMTIEKMGTAAASGKQRLSFDLLFPYLLTTSLYWTAADIRRLHYGRTIRSGRGFIWRGYWKSSHYPRSQFTIEVEVLRHEHVH